MSKLLVVGYFGAGNLGDDAILLGFLEGIRNDRYDVSITAGNPEEMHRMYGVNAVQRRDLGALKNAIESSDAVVFAGGSIFQDVTSIRSTLYYANIIRTAKKADKRVVMLGQGVGPLKTLIGRKVATKAFNMCDAIAVRDPDSAQTLKTMGVRIPPQVTGDMAFMLPLAKPSDSSEAFQVGDMRIVGLAPRPFGKDKEVIQLFVELSRQLFAANLMPMLIEMDRGEDGPLIDEINKAQGGKVPSIHKIATPMQLQQRLMRTEAMIAMRLHAGILASTVGVPPYMISYDPKVSAFATMMELPPAPSLTGLSSQKLFENFMSFYLDREKHKEHLLRNQAKLSQSAAKNIELLREFMQPR